VTNFMDLTDEEFLACLGPAWSEMSEAHRAKYPHDGPFAPDIMPAPEAPRNMTARAIAARERLAAAMGEAS